MLWSLYARGTTDPFLCKHRQKINAALECFDRMLFRGYLPIQSGWAMAQFLNQKNIRFRNWSRTKGSRGDWPASSRCWSPAERFHSDSKEGGRLSSPPNGNALVLILTLIAKNVTNFQVASSLLEATQAER